ncbi:MAG: DUF177 domain-containing protein [Acidobacteria bacterium]|nr:DUF177 domain-containing protein [Acidobacteriota bacterium]
MKIEIESLTEGGKDFERVYAPEELPLEDEFARLASRVRVRGRARRKRGEVEVRGSLDTSVELPCDRCAAPVVLPVNVDFKAELGFADANAASEEATELQDEDMDFSVVEGDAVDLDEIAREQILLALPTRMLCGEGCKGLCPTCGANLNERDCGCAQKEIDPRWSALAALKKP